MTPGPGSGFTLTVLGTTDLHANVFNWDYYADREYDDPAHDDVGLAKIATLVRELRRTAPHALLIDAGDTIQGTPLGHYYAAVEPALPHPMAVAMNAIGYTAAAVGNHEFNYGIPHLRAFERQLDFPLLAANALTTTGAPAFLPHTTVSVHTGSTPLRVGILGLTNPGVAVWDKTRVDGHLTFPGVVEQARIDVPALARQSDLVIVAAHSGAGLSSSLGDLLPFPENCAALLAEEVAGIDAVLVGHAHVEIPQRHVVNRATGRKVLLTEPLYWGKRLSVMEFDLADTPDGWQLTESRAHVRHTNTVPEDPAITALLRTAHDRVVTYTNSRIGTCRTAMSVHSARYQRNNALDFVNHVQATTLALSLSLPAAAPFPTTAPLPTTHPLPVLSITCPFTRNATIPAGDVSIRDVAALYPFENTLVGVELTGSQLKDYLERSATYFRPQTTPGPHHPDDLTNADDTPDSLYDVAAGHTAPLTYDIDLARPAGDRVTNLHHAHAPIRPEDRFAVAVNSYRQSGGGNFPHVPTAPVLHSRHQEIRRLLIDWVGAAGGLDPAAFGTSGWRLVVDGTPVVIR
ncbi:5'-nucleotidase C-terminal domain-containing protein [Actinosynnema sp. NPDC047251]|uniref:2',3'-cyclic-nucleotide 2'-phosphodiesterase n=1 Tax=Saccharothrix espanaensis (strain ATCC 51144 / DSM 44229 / JCM 9112 / NBRC 15066 / NRRL 15764) TaxID=1179773 RepID=K0JZV2_SACES|nr:5'-nucleotidase C-terminal domain-containing protein [Saccharothrix espanaensis]CCH29833.1 2',3'-cyclic-nucleotide 2'-phosphodiesterase [Saccharothrix espanaensis DSM 44229]